MSRHTEGIHRRCTYLIIIFFFGEGVLASTEDEDKHQSFVKVSTYLADSDRGKPFRMMYSIPLLRVA
jgi:hypothetical protein